VAGAAAIAFGAVISPCLVRQLGPSTFPAYLSVTPDWRLVGFMTCAGAVATIFFGVIPALGASAVNPYEALKSSSGHTGRAGALRPFLPVQVAFSFMVLFLSGLLLVSFAKLIHVDLGFAKENVILFTLDATGVKPAMRGALQANLIDHLSHIPGVRAASLSQQGPIGGAFAFIGTPFIRFPGRGTETLRPRHIPVSPGFFAAMQIPLLSGREFNRLDGDAEKTSAAIVNQAFAVHFFPGRSALGQHFEQTGDGNPIPREVVGVVANSLFNNLREPVTPTLYSPLQTLQNAALEVRTQTDPAPLSGLLRREIESVDPSLKVRSAILQATRIDDTLIGERLLAWIAGFFGVAATVLVAVGLHGVVSYFVVRRTKDIGIRMALGAERAAVVRLIVLEVAALIGLGIAAGAIAGFALSRYAASLLFGVKPAEFGSLAAPLVVLLLACVVAALRPALRATRIDPVVALRCE
ncbi:MAG: FtsX-like permease family protein, partial [Acidobacteriota bacterium]